MMCLEVGWASVGIVNASQIGDSRGPTPKQCRRALDQCGRLVLATHRDELALSELTPVAESLQRSIGLSPETAVLIDALLAALPGADRLAALVDMRAMQVVNTLHRAGLARLPAEAAEAFMQALALWDANPGARAAAHYLSAAGHTDEGHKRALDAAVLLDHLRSRGTPDGWSWPYIESCTGLPGPAAVS